MRRENSIWLTRAQLGAALVLVGAVCTASFFVGLIVGEGDPEAAVEQPATHEVASAALLGPELEGDTLTELLARVEVLPSAQAAALEFPRELVTSDVEADLPQVPEEAVQAPVEVLPEPTGAPTPPEEPAEEVGAGWAIEVSSHADPLEAAEVVGRLAEDGFKAKVISVLYGGQTRHRVRIGPISNSDDAQALKREVAASLGRPVDLVEVR